MSGLVVRPGDTVVVPVNGEAGPIHPDDVAKIQRDMQAAMPRVTVVLFQGMGGDAFAYRPDPEPAS